VVSDNRKHVLVLVPKILENVNFIRSLLVLVYMMDHKQQLCNILVVVIQPLLEGVESVDLWCFYAVLRQGVPAVDDCERIKTS